MGTKNDSENFVSSIISSNTNTFSPSKYQYVSTANNQPQLVANVVNAAGKPSNTINSSAYSGKHKLPMQLSRPPATGSVGVSVITPAAGVKTNQKEVHYKQQRVPQHHMQKVQSARSGSDGFSRVNSYANSKKMASSPSSAGLAGTPVNHYTHNTKSVSSAGSSISMVQSHTQHLPKFLSSSRFLVNTEKGDTYLNDDGFLGEIPDKRAQYSIHMPPDFQYVLQDHSYSQLPESPPPAPVPTSPIHPRTTINGHNRMSSSGPTKVTLNNNRLVNVGGVGFSSLPNNVNSNRLSNQGHVSYTSNSMNNYSNALNNNSNSLHNNISNAIASNLKKNHPHGGAGVFAHIPKGLLKGGLISEKPEESDLSEDDRMADPHGEETETAPEAEGEEESVTRCICDFQHDDGYMICCDKCLAWQHVVCMGVDWHHIPDEYQCERCQPRYVDKRRAIEIQKKKIAEKLCVGLNDDSDSSDAPAPNARGNKNQTKKKCKGKRTIGMKRKNIRASKDAKPKKNLGSAKKRNIVDSTLNSSSPQSLSLSNSGLSAEKKKQLLIERKQMLLEKKQITKKRSMRKQAQTKRNQDKTKMEDDYEPRNSYSDKDDNNHSIQQVREWVDRYEEAVTNHYSQELRARLNASQVNSGNSDLKFTASLRTVEKCRTSLLSTGGKIVLATSSLSPNQPIIELRGKYMYTGADAFKQSKITQYTPYVFYYKLPLPKQDIEICVDCRSYGNFARFIRRSCKPNAELRHCIQKTSLHLYIIATQPLKKNSEILIGHYSPETANTCVCGSPNCTAADTPYPTFSSLKLNDKSKESQHPTRSSSPVSGEATNSKNKKTPVNADKNKKKLKEEKKKLTKENRRGRRRSPSFASNSDQESSSRDESPLPSAKLTVSLWGKPGVLPPSAEVNNKSSSDDESQHSDHAAATVVTHACNDSTANTTLSATATFCMNLKSAEAAGENSTSVTTTAASVTSTTTSTTASGNNSPSTNMTNDMNNSSGSENVAGSGNSTPKQATRSTRQAEYARKEKQQLDMPLFFETPNNHKMTREEKKIQAIMKVFEAMEKSEARKQENQKHRRESTSENDTANKKNFTSRKGVKGRKNTDERDEKPNGKIRKDSMNEDDEEEQDGEGSKENSMKGSIKIEPRADDLLHVKKSGIIENGGRIKVESKDDEEESNDSDTADKEMAADNRGLSSKKQQSPSRVNNNKVMCENKGASEDESESETSRPKRNEKSKNRVPPAKTPRMARTTPKARATPKPKITSAKKRKSESEADDSPDISDIRERTRSAVLRQKKTVTPEKNALGYSPNRFRKTDEMLMSPCATPPKMRERLDSTSSSGGTPPTPVSDTCLLVASAIGHLTDFKFPNTKKELMNAWFKEERKPSPDEENTNKLPNQEGNNEYAKKRWLRQAISEEGDHLLPRPEEAVSPNGEYGGPLKKRRFARESMSEQMCSSPTSNSLGSTGQMYDDETDLSSPEASLFRASEGDGVATCHPVSLPASPSQELTNVVKSEERSILFKRTATEAIMDELSASHVDEEIAKVASESVADTIASILAPVNAQMASPPRPPSVPPPRTPSPPPEEVEKLAPQVRSPPVSKKKLSLTEYQRRKGAVVPPTLPPPPASEPVDDVAQEIAALAATPASVADITEALGRSSSRSSVTSSSASEDEDDSHAASAQVIARSLMIESRHLSYGPQASALFNSIRSGTPAQLFNSKKSATGAPLPRENLEDRLKREFGVTVQEEENEKNKNAALPSSPSKIPVQITVNTTHAEKEVNFRIKKGQPPPPPPPLPIIPPRLLPLPPLPEPPQLFAPTFYPYPVARMASFFTAPPPPPPSGPPPPPPPSK